MPLAISSLWKDIDWKICGRRMERRGKIRKKGESCKGERAKTDSIMQLKM